MNMDDLEARLIKIVRDKQETEQLATVRHIAKKLKISHETVLEICCDAGLNINIGFRTGAGFVEYDLVGDYTIEDLTT